MDWLEHRQDAIEGERAAPSARRALRPTRRGLRHSAWVLRRPEGTRSPRAALRLLPGRQKRKTADRVRAAHRPGGTPGRGPGVSRQHRRPVRVHRDRGRGAEDVRAAPDGHGRRPRHDHQRPDPGPEPAGRRDTAAGCLRVDHRAARPRHQEAHGRRRTPPAQPLRPAGPGRDHLRGLPRRAADRLPQPGAGRRPRPHPPGPARCHREAAGPRATARVAAGRLPGCRRDRGRGRQGDQHVQDRQALRRHHHR